MLQDAIAARDAAINAISVSDADTNARLALVGRAWERLDGFEPGVRALIEGAFVHAHFHPRRLETQRVATGNGVASLIAYAADRSDLNRPLHYRLVGTLSWEPTSDPAGRFALIWDEEILRYGERERRVSFPASIFADGTLAVNGGAFSDAVATAME